MRRWSSGSATGSTGCRWRWSWRRREPGRCRSTTSSNGSTTASGLLTTGGRTVEPRQQTLRRVVDWSYDLLFADEQRVFRRLSVFAGGFDLAAAEAVCAGDDVAAGDIVDILGHLVDKSLVSVIEPRRRHPLPTAADPRRLRPGAPGRGRRGRRDP